MQNIYQTILTNSHLTYWIKVRVGVAQGVYFGENGEGFLRFSYANSMGNITEGMNRVEQYLKSAMINETQF